MALKIGQRVWDFLDERFLLSQLIAFGKKKTVPEHRHSFWYFFGGICLFLTMIQVATGAMLLLYYTPHIDAAHESIQFIMSGVKFGWLIRSVHSWTANILVGLLFVHMFSTFFLKAYRKPRELTWITGFLLLVLFMAFGFSGYLLPWNELSYFATRVGTDIAGSLPFIGKGLKTIILGGPEVSQATLSRFFWFHVALLPLAALDPHRDPHLPRPDLGHEQAHRRARDEGDPLLPRLPVQGRTRLDPHARPRRRPLRLPSLGDRNESRPAGATPLGIKPEWYFTFMFSTLKIVPAHILSFEGEKLAILAFMAGGLLWMLVPFLDRRAGREKRSPLFTWIGLALAAYIAVMTVLTYALPKL